MRKRSEHFSAKQIAERFGKEKGVVDQIALWIKQEWKEDPEMDLTHMEEHVVFDYFQGRDENGTETEEMVSDIVFAVSEGDI